MDGLMRLAQLYEDERRSTHFSESKRSIKDHLIYFETSAMADGIRTFSSSGFTVTRDGWALVTYHAFGKLFEHSVMERNPKVHGIGYSKNGEAYSVDSQMFFGSPKHDLALVKLNGYADDDSEYVPMADEIRSGSVTLNTFLGGSSHSRKAKLIGRNDNDYWRLTKQSVGVRDNARDGESGSPLLNNDGELVTTVLESAIGCSPLTLGSSPLYMKRFLKQSARNVY